MDTHEWLQALYGEADGYLAVTAFAKGKARKTGWFSTDDLDRAARTITKTAERADVYVSVALHDEPQESGRGTSKTAIALPGFWADLDIGTDGHKPSAEGLPNPETEEEALSIIAGLPEPTAIIHSGGGLQVWWLFDEPWTEPDAKITQAWQDLITRRGKARGLHVDSVGDLARILRAPGTWNHKLAERRPVELRSFNGNRYSVAELAALTYAPKASEGSWADILEPHGWTLAGTRGTDGAELWARPGKDPRQGHSAVANPYGVPVLVNFSATAGLPVGAGCALTKERVSALLNGQAEPEASWHDFGALVRGERQRALPEYGKRTDGVALLYPGKEHSIYAETEAGKTMLEAAIVKWCLDAGVPVAVVDFEEGDEMEWGSRLLDMGAEPEALTNRSLFRYGTPASYEEADALLADILEMQPALVIYEGVSACYGLYGWQIKENDSATAFRSHLIRPCIDVGIATLSSDHVTKVSDTRGRYAIGGVMKLNMVNGVAYMLESYQPIRRGEVGASLVYVTKDRPGSVKPHCTKTKEPGRMRFGTLNVDSTMNGFLTVYVTPPPDDVAESEPADTLADQIFKVIAGLPGRTVESRRKLRAAVTAAGISARHSDVDAATDYLVALGRLEEFDGPRHAVGLRVPASLTVPQDPVN